MSATIEIQYRDGRTEQRAMAAGTWTIGRETGDIVLDDPRVSGLHGELTLKGPVLTFTDRDSSNGSFDAGGQRLSGPVVLKQGSVVRLGECRLTVTTLPPPPNPLKGRTMVMGSAAALTGAAQADPPQDQSAAFAATVAQPSTEAAGSAAGQAQAQASSAPEARQVSAGPANVWELNDDGGDAQASQQPGAQPSAAASQAFESGAAAGAAASPGTSAADSTDATAAGTTSEPSADGPGMGFETPKASVPGDASRPFGVGVTTRAGEGMGGFFEQLKPRLMHIWQLYEPHLYPLAKLVGLVAIPLAFVNLLLSMIPVLGWLAQIVIAPLGIAAMYVWAHGAVNQYAHRIFAGEQVDYDIGFRAQSNALGPWGISSLIAGLPAIASTFLALTVILAPLALLLVIPTMMLTWALGPAFVKEGLRGADAPLRSYRLFKADWKHILQAFAILIIGTIPVYIAGAILGAIPLFGALVSAAVQMLVLPFSALYSYGLYHETMARLQNAGRHVE